VNNSTNAAVIYPNVRWQPGGGNPHVLLFDGTGDWIVTNNLTFRGTPFGANIGKAGSGTLFWSGPSIAGALGSGFIDSPLDFEGGRVVLLASGLIGTQRITNNGVMFEYAAPAAQTLSGPITGIGMLKVSNGTLTLSGLNDYTGTTIVSNGTLFINRTSASPTVVVGGTLGGNGVVSASVTLFAGATLSPGASAGAIGTFTNNGDLNLGGNVAIDVNKSLAQSNDFVVVTGGLTNTGTGTLTVSNHGPALMIGDKFTLFSKPLTNGAALTVAGAGATWVNNLAVDGSISVTFVNRPALNFAQPIASSLQFSWDTSFGNYKLQSQTNSLATSLGTNWSDYPGGDASPVTVPLGVTNGAVFFRLVSTP
jgi:autotransporter-associated beta strand protein